MSSKHSPDTFNFKLCISLMATTRSWMEALSCKFDHFPETFLCDLCHICIGLYKYIYIFYCAIDGPTWHHLRIIHHTWLRTHLLFVRMRRYVTAVMRWWRQVIKSIKTRTRLWNILLLRCQKINWRSWKERKNGWSSNMKRGAVWLNDHKISFRLSLKYHIAWNLKKNLKKCIPLFWYTF